MAEFAEIEAKDGVRMTWNVWPGSHGDAVECAIPTAVVYAPLHPSPNLALLPYSPLRCKSCRSLLNPYCSVDFVVKIWICPFCFQRNYFPEHYQAISENNLPAELYPDYTTVEYLLSENPGTPPVYLFTVDTCIIEEELEFLKKSLIQAIALIPPNALVGLITFGTFVHVHELGSTEFPKFYVFRGSKDVSKDQLIDTLGLSSKKQRPAVIAGVFDGLSAKDIRRFLVPSTECEFTLNSVLEELERDQWLIQPGERATRCTSTALQIAANLLGVCVPGTAGRILSFLGGPCTEGSGMIVAKDLSESIRSHKDLEKNAAPHYLHAVKFYEALSKQLMNQGHVLDLFACSVDQVGVAEMKVAVERTGGIIVLAESFGHTVFKESFKRIFELGESSLGSAFNAIFEVNCTRDLKVQGVIGPCASLNKKGVSVSDNVVGQGGSTAWKMNGLSSNLTLSIFFDTIPAEARGVSSVVQQLFFQFLTYYQHSDGKMRMRCTTVARQCTSGTKNVEELVSGFDQETAAAIMARLVSFKMETEAEFDATKWLDKALINVSSRFGNYVKDDPSSFSLSSRLAIFPQFMFNLRRSQFVQVFNNSPDETAYHRMLLNRETVVNSVVMIQPSLISYSFNSPPEPALLDVAAIMPDRILLLDSYFTIVIFHGMTIAQWRKDGYHNQPEHKVFAQLLQAPKDDADAIMKTRFPAPRLVVCDQHGSQARFLLAKLNPSTTHRSGQVVGGGDVIFTDDVSFEVFMEHLQRLAVQS